MTAVTGILLAAGHARRFGSQKLLHPLPDGTPVVVAAARTLLAAVPTALAVVRPGDEALIGALRDTGIDVVENRDDACLMADSLAAGIRATPDAKGWLIALGDMPWVEPRTAKTLVEQLANGASIVAPAFDGQRGNPVEFAARWRDRLLALQGDQGARQLLKAHADAITLCHVDDPGVIRDVDHPHDLSDAPVPP